jgi:hypothetical protein
MPGAFPPPALGRWLGGVNSPAVPYGTEGFFDYDSSTCGVEKHFFAAHNFIRANTFRPSPFFFKKFRLRMWTSSRLYYGGCTCGDSGDCEV